jgi:hypothetical protein
MCVTDPGKAGSRLVRRGWSAHAAQSSRPPGRRLKRCTVGAALTNSGIARPAFALARPLPYGSESDAGGALSI